MLLLVHDAQAQLVNEVSLEDSNFSNMSKKIISQCVFVEVVSLHLSPRCSGRCFPT